MIYISYGITKSGSTLAFELTKRLLEVHGHPQEFLGSDIIHGNIKMNILPTFESDTIEKINNKIPPEKIIVIKTHGKDEGITPVVKALASKGVLTGHANFRDPRDNILSLRDAGIRAREKSKKAFSHITDIETAIRAYAIQLARFENWIKIPGFIRTNYETVAFSSATFLKQVSDQLNLPALSDEMLQNIEIKVKGNAFTQFNKGIRRRHRNELSLNECIRLTSTFRDALTNHMPELIDDLDRALMEASATLPQPGMKPSALHVPQTHRNTPCPCGSGKRYKQCCGQL